MMHPTSPLPAGSRPRVPRRDRRPSSRWLPLLAAALLAACGGDGTGATPAATVELTGVPENVVLVGTTVPLTATAFGADGEVLERPVTWLSSDAAIATVDATGLVSVVGMGTVTVTARADGRQASATLDARAGGEMGPAGGTLRLLDGRITLTLQPGALPFPMLFVFRPAVSPPPDPRGVPGTAFDMEPIGLFASPPPLLTLAYDPARLPAGATESGLQLYQVVSGAWRVVTGSVADTARNTVRGIAAAGGTFAVAAAAPGTVAIDGALATGAVYVGQTRPLQAFPLAEGGDTLRGRTIVWSTSDPTRATVDATGNVTGTGAGTVTITATVEGVRGSVVVSVLPRPAARWGGGEWTTLQGGPRHDGHVPATLDPTAFRDRWSKSIGDFPAQPAVAAGRVFVTTGVYSTRQVTAFDAVTGAVSWTRTFPASGSVTAPAYGGGQVYVLAKGTEGALWAFDAATGFARFTQPYDDNHLGGQPVVAAGGVFVGGSGGSRGGVHRFDAATGARSWQTAVPGMDGQPPAVDDDGRVLVFGTAGTNSVDGLSALNAADGSVAYTATTFYQGGVRVPVLGGDGNVVVVVGGQLSSVRLPTGDLAWSQPGTYPTFPVVGGGVVYATRSHDVVAIRERDGALLWTWTPRRGTPWGPPLVTDNLLFVSTQTLGPGGAAQYVTDAIDLASGKQVWSYPAGGSLALGADGVLFIAANGVLTSNGTYGNGTLHAIAVR